METDNLPTHLLTLPQGQIKGMQRQGIYQDSYYSFEGIPYGKPPLGELRFKAPQPATPWEGVKDCTNFASKPMQKNVLTSSIEGSEDCLYLNVYAKTLKSEKPLPVLVFIYGGGFYMGEATRDLYSPDYFMHHDVILVTFNYRLCSLGFLKLSDPELEVPGNAGLKDQVLALKWVKQYIAHFNGDVNNITVFGESAGGCSTHYMLATEQTRGLFHKAMLMSGTVLHNWSTMPQTDLAYRLAKYHGYEGENNDKQVLAYLRVLEPKKLVDHVLLDNEDRKNGVLFPFTPCIEAYVSADCVVPKAPIEMLRTTWSNEIPVIISGTSDEGILMYPRLKMFPQSMSAMKNNPERFIPPDVRQKHTDDEIMEMSKKIIKTHFGEREPSENSLTAFVDYYSYRIFWHGFHRTVLSRLNYATAPTYLHRFNFDSPDFNHYRTKFVGKDPVRGVAHADDLCYLFFSNNAWKVAEDSAEFKTIQRTVGFRVAFAKTSDPNCDILKPVLWQPLKKDNPFQTLNISEDVKIIDLPEKDKLQVWDTLYEQSDLY